MTPGLRRLAQSGGLVAAAFALKYPLIGLPNIEPLTLAFFAVGYGWGLRWGALVGAVGMALYASFNPWGAAIPPVWAAQVIGMALAGAAGGVIRRVAGTTGRHWIVATVAGVIVTLIYDLLTNLAIALTIGPFWPMMAAALPFAAIHITSNALLFGLIFPILTRWLLRPARAVVPPHAS
jgi:hypothetical protein